MISHQAENIPHSLKSPDFIWFRIISLYCIGYSCYGVLLPFLPLILREGGLTDIEAAFVLGAIGIAAIFGPPMFGNITDRGVAVPRVMQCLFALVALISPLYLLLEGSAPAFFLVFAHFLCMIPILSLADQYTMNLISMRQPSSVAF